MIAVYAEVAMGALGWPPSEFWNSTAPEVRLAIEGKQQALGIQKPISPEEIRELAERYPDGRSIKNQPTARVVTE